MKNIEGSQIANNGGRIKNSTNKFQKKDKTNNISISVFWPAAGAGFIGGLIASIIANLICG